MSEGKTFKEFLRNLLLFSKQYQLALVHEDFNRELLRLGLPTVALSTFYNHLNLNGPNPPVEWVAPLYNVTKDITILNYIMNNTRVMLTNRPQAGQAGEVKDELLDTVSASSRIFTETIRAIKDSRFTQDEVDEILKAIDDGQLELEELRNTV